MKNHLFFVFIKKQTDAYLIVLPFLFLISSPLNNTQAQNLKGDKDALVMVENMFKNIGGVEVWKNAQSIYVELLGYYSKEEEPWEEEYWMSLTEPYGRFVLKRTTGDQIIAWTPKGGWDQNEGRLATMDKDRHSFELSYWKRQAVVIFHRLANGDSGIKVGKGGNEFSFNVVDSKSGDFLVSFVLNKKGEPIKWKAKIEDREFEHVFGPMKNFGNVSQPAWGATPSGVWRYDHYKVSLSNETPPVSFDRPSGGKK